MVEIEFLGGGKQRLLRFYIDRAGRRHARRIARIVSQKVGAILDAEDVIPGENYTLEVSSPGVERKLTKPAGLRAFLRSEGKDRNPRTG